jgi:hypothetical protein
MGCLHNRLPVVDCSVVMPLHRQRTFQEKNQKTLKIKLTQYVLRLGAGGFPFRRCFAGFLNGNWRFWFLAGFDNAVVKPLHRSQSKHFPGKEPKNIQNSMYC